MLEALFEQLAGGYFDHLQQLVENLPDVNLQAKGCNLIHMAVVHYRVCLLINCCFCFGCEFLFCFSLMLLCCFNRRELISMFKHLMAILHYI